MALEKWGLYLGSFNPMTIGHEDILEKAIQSRLFDKIILCRGVNPQKNEEEFMDGAVLYDIAKTKSRLHNMPIEMLNYTGLTTDFVQMLEAQNKDKAMMLVIRGLRSIADFESEKYYAQTLKQINPSATVSIKMLYFMCAPEFQNVSSSMVRGLLKLGKTEEAKRYLAPYRWANVLGF